MTGKEKCKLLRTIRREIAETNGIAYFTSDCTFEGACTGTCPMCDAEIRYLDNEINKMVASGKKVSLAGLSLKTYAAATSEPKNQDLNIVPDFPEVAGIMAYVGDEDPLETTGVMEYVGDEDWHNQSKVESHTPTTMGVPKPRFNWFKKNK